MGTRISVISTEVKLGTIIHWRNNITSMLMQTVSQEDKEEED